MHQPEPYIAYMESVESYCVRLSIFATMASAGVSKAIAVNRSFSNVFIPIPCFFLDLAEPRSRRPEAREPALVDRMQSLPSWSK